MGNELDFLLEATRKSTEAKTENTTSYAKIAKALLDSCHPKQRQFVEDPHRRIVALVGRGAGKTRGGERRFLYRMLTTPRAECLYIATARTAAEELLWASLKDLNEKYRLGAKFNETKLRMTLPNGSYLRLVGADDKREIEKLRGLPFHEVGIDEAASHDPVLLDNLIHRVIGPRLGDYRGTLWLIGTPGNRLQGPFYEWTRVASPLSRLYEKRADFPDWNKWSLHKWHLQHNTKGGHLDDCPRDCAQPHLWDEALIMKASNGWTDENPIWRREILGEWALDDTGFVYKFRRYTDDGLEWNCWTPEPPSEYNPFGLPAGHEWNYIYGVDMGFKDPFALNILAYSPTHPDLFHCYGFSKAGLVTREIADVLKDMIKITGYPDQIVADTAGLGDWIVEEMGNVYAVPMVAAHKKDKPDAIELLNSDMVDGRFKILRDSDLENEFVTLQWDPDKPLQEAKGMANHNCDSVIYARKWAQHHHAVGPTAPRPPKGSLAQLEEWAREEEDRASRASSVDGEMLEDDDGRDLDSF